jgi:hypothetical protein
MVVRGTHLNRNYLADENDSRLENNPLLGDSEGAAMKQQYRLKYYKYAHGAHKRSL